MNLDIASDLAFNLLKDTDVDDDDSSLSVDGSSDADTSSNVSMTNLVSNAGVVATDTTGVGTARRLTAACSFN